ncbi:DNA-processing protein DprA [Cognatiyoonia sp. IB215182]|uniref:DNA-processing protein DprA n=1 Tax=Cognatiyoonia sp. IB215182 TaxID=3097353 RepID=UPI002A0C4C4F|nr:DNA-processing protein DprA [Cognatiyoonia sp. IB215182]MDX8351471.1 DNA-processing protein DprA [Cognatiyoonia sp. IB215182]
MAGTHISSTHPPLHPTTEDDAVNRLRLLRSRRVGVATYRRLMAEHGDAGAALKALPEIAKAAGVKGYEVCPAGMAKAEMQAAKAAGAQLLKDDSPDYPSNLATIDDAPPLLWALGDIALLQKPMIAIVGARNASSLGTRMAKRLAQDLTAQGYVIVSGLARGIDTAAHHGALDGGTIAVQAGGVDVIYPAENAGLAKDIATKGLRLSEAPMGLQPQARHFPARNRIISGLARAVVVVEAAAKSGSLITARNALDQARDVLAVPGHPFDARAAGCNLLLRDGATLVRNADDVIEALDPIAAETAELPLVPPPSSSAKLRDTAALHNMILARLGPAPIAEDQLLRDIEAPATSVAPVLVDLELDGKITRQAGGLLARVV